MANKSISISDEIISQVEELAQEERRSFSNMIEVLLEIGLKGMKGTKDKD